MEYTTYPIIRTKRLSDEYFEIVLKRKREIVYKPGDCLLVKKGTSDEYTPYFIASGVAEPWIRIIVRNGTSLNECGHPGKLRVKTNLVNIFPNLNDDKSPVFICSSVGIGPFFSYISTYPGSKTPVYTVGNVPNLDWIKNYPQAIVCSDLNELEQRFEVKRSNTYYICGQTETAQAIKNIITSAGIKDKKIMYVDFQ